MRKLTLGLASGLGLGFLDGASAAFNPAAASMLAVIIGSATVKGAMTGGIVGLLARKLDGISRNIVAGAVVGLALSVLAAIPAGAFWEIVVPGLVIGMLVGLIVAKWGQ